MFNFKNYLVGASLLFATALCATSASAATVIGSLQGIAPGGSITLHAVRPNGTPIGQQVLAGLANFTRTGGTDTDILAGEAGSFLAFCVEPFENAYLNANYTYTVDPLANAANSSISGGIGVAKATQIGSLFGQFAPNLAAPMSAIQASALQLAIWEIVSELSSNPFDVTSGNTYFTAPGSNIADVLNLSQSYLNYVSSSNGTGPQAQGLKALTIGGNQDFLVQVVSVAPEPGTWLMMLLGFGLIGHAMRARPGTRVTRNNRFSLAPSPIS